LQDFLISSCDNYEVVFPDQIEKAIIELKLARSIFMYKNSSDSITQEKRSELRSTKLRDYRVEIKFVGEPIYQFKVADVSTKGAGLLINDSSAFLKLIEIGQIVDVNFISPKGSNPSGMYKVEIRHITKIDKGRYNGHRLVGILILESLNQS
jgi:hypothetical protein